MSWNDYNYTSTEQQVKSICGQQISTQDIYHSILICLKDPFQSVSLSSLSFFYHSKYVRLSPVHSCSLVSTLIYPNVILLQLCGHSPLSKRCPPYPSFQFSTKHCFVLWVGVILFKVRNYPRHQ